MVDPSIPRPELGASETERMEPNARPKGITARTLLLCLVLIPLNNYWIMQTETIRYAGFPTTISLYYNVVFILLILTIVNLLLTRVKPSWALSHGELGVVYIVLCLASSTAGHDAIQ